MHDADAESGPRVVVVARDGAKREHAADLAARLNIPHASDLDLDLGDVLVLEVSHDGLALARTGPRPPRPVRVDFAAPELARRVRIGGREALVRAIKGKRARIHDVVDATAGLGVDAFVLASRGLRVRMIEGNPVVHALLEDGLRRARATPSTAPIADRLELVHADSRESLAELAALRPIDAIYLDPMFPETHGKNTAMPARAMQSMRRLGPDRSAGILLEALRHAGRVVVKRPRTGAWLDDVEPTHSVRERACRFDVYLRPDVHRPIA